MSARSLKPGWRMVTFEEGTSFTRKFVPGQTLFGKRRAYQRKVAFAEFEGICSGDILTFEPKSTDALLPELLPFICQTDAFFEHALNTSAGSLSPRTSWSALQGFQFPLPPLDEQKRIAEILWAADEAVEAYTIAYNKLVKLSEAIVECDICSMLYPWQPLGSVLTAILAGKSVVGSTMPAKPNEYGVLKVSAVGATGFKPDENKRLLRSEDFLHRYRINNGALLITRCNTTALVGRVCIVQSDFHHLMLCDKTLQLILDENIVNIRFVYEALRSHRVRTQIAGLATGTGGAMKNLSQQDLRSLLIPLPSKESQNIAIHKVSQIAKQKDIISGWIARLVDLKKQVTRTLIC